MVWLSSCVICTWSGGECRVSSVIHRYRNLLVFAVCINFLPVFLNQSPLSEWDSISFVKDIQYFVGTGVGEWGSDGLKQIKYWHAA